MRHGPLLAALDLGCDVPPYARMNIVNGADGETKYVGNKVALRRLKAFYKEFEAEVDARRQAPPAPIEEPVIVVMKIFKRRWGLGDGSNLQKSVEDALGFNRGKKASVRAGVLKDDAQIRRSDVRVLAPFAPRLVVLVYRDLTPAEVLDETNEELDEARRELDLMLTGGRV